MKKKRTREGEDSCRVREKRQEEKQRKIPIRPG